MAHQLRLVTEALAAVHSGDSEDAPLLHQASGIARVATLLLNQIDAYRGLVALPGPAPRPPSKPHRICRSRHPTLRRAWSPPQVVAVLDALSDPQLLLDGLVADLWWRHGAEVRHLDGDLDPRQLSLRDDPRWA